MKVKRDRPSKSLNHTTFRVSNSKSKLPPKLVPPSPINFTEIDKVNKGKVVFLNIPKTAEHKISKSDNEYNNSPRSFRLNSPQNQKQVDDNAVNNLLQVLMNKSNKFKQTITAYGQQIAKWIMQSQSLKIKTLNIFEKLVQQRRLGIDLKGLNLSIIAQIQKGLMSTLTFQAEMYQKQKQFRDYKNQITDSLKEYKDNLKKQIELAARDKANAILN